MVEEKKKEKKLANKGQREGDIKTIQWLCGGVPMANKAKNEDYFCQRSRQISSFLPPLPHTHTFQWQILRNGNEHGKKCQIQNKYRT